MGGGKIEADAPEPIDPGKSMGEYLFGKNFRKDYQGVTDPRLQERILGAERTYRPQYTALELADIGVMARGIEGGSVNPEYSRLENELAGLKAGQEYEGIGAAKREAAIKEAALKLFPNTSGASGKTMRGDGAFTRSKISQAEKRKEYIDAAMGTGVDRASRIAEIESQLQGMPKTLEGTPGLFDLLEEQSGRAGELQREQLKSQRESDVAALEEFSPRIVEAYRSADPYSTELADLASNQAKTLYAEGEGQLSPERRRLAEQAARSGSIARGRLGDESSIASEILGREGFRSGLRAEARQAGGLAFQQQRAMSGDIGSVLLGRPSQSIGLGSQVLGQAQMGASGPMGPQLFDPNVGINMALQQRGQDISFQGAQSQANSAMQAAAIGAAGTLGSAAIGACWVAREVYGASNPNWLLFREWLFNASPNWFFKLYLKFGKRFAGFISNKPRIKSIIRNWMNTKIK